jgi:SAM-dependent methyltransferase
LRSTCRVCGSTDLATFLSLGPTPLANGFLTSAADFTDERRFPLDVSFCRSCTFVQLLDVIDHETLFRHYVYLSGTSETTLAHNRELAAAVDERLNLGSGDLVVEIASNDGSLLKCFPAGVRVLGVEPARNIAAAARAAGVATIDRFFDSSAAVEIRSTYGPATAVLANNVLAHVDSPRDFLAGARMLLRPGGLVVVEVPYLVDLIERLEYDTVYHEHLGYFSVRAVLALAERAGLSVAAIDRLRIHGGSLRVWLRPSAELPGHAPEVVALAEAERHDGFDDLARYLTFADEVAENRRHLVGLLEDLHARGCTVAGYGAPAKGNTLLNYCGIGPRLLPYTVDKNPLKVGRYTPGAHIPVLPVTTLLERQPDYVLILAWNVAEEVMRQQGEYRARGGKFIVPIPEPAVV